MKIEARDIHVLRPPGLIQGVQSPQQPTVQLRVDLGARGRREKLSEALVAERPHHFNV
jgi:hypothetical protein